MGTPMACRSLFCGTHVAFGSKVIAQSAAASFCNDQKVNSLTPCISRAAVRSSLIFEWLSASGAAVDRSHICSSHPNGAVGGMDSDLRGKVRSMGLKLLSPAAVAAHIIASSRKGDNTRPSSPSHQSSAAIGLSERQVAVDFARYVAADITGGRTLVVGRALTRLGHPTFLPALLVLPWFTELDIHTSSAEDHVADSPSTPPSRVVVAKRSLGSRSPCLKRSPTAGQSPPMSSHDAALLPSHLPAAVFGGAALALAEAGATDAVVTVLHALSTSDVSAVAQTVIGIRVAITLRRAAEVPLLLKSASRDGRVSLAIALMAVHYAALSRDAPRSVMDHLLRDFLIPSIASASSEELSSVCAVPAVVAEEVANAAVCDESRMFERHVSDAVVAHGAPLVLGCTGGVDPVMLVDRLVASLRAVRRGRDSSVSERRGCGDGVVRVGLTPPLTAAFVALHAAGYSHMLLSAMQKAIKRLADSDVDVTREAPLAISSSPDGGVSLGRVWPFAGLSAAPWAASSLLGVLSVQIACAATDDNESLSSPASLPQRGLVCGAASSAPLLFGCLVAVVRCFAFTSSVVAAGLRPVVSSLTAGPSTRDLSDSLFGAPAMVGCAPLPHPAIVRVTDTPPVANPCPVLPPSLCPHSSFYMLPPSLSPSPLLSSVVEAVKALAKCPSTSRDAAIFYDTPSVIMVSVLAACPALFYYLPEEEASHNVEYSPRASRSSRRCIASAEQEVRTLTVLLHGSGATNSFSRGWRVRSIVASLPAFSVSSDCEEGSSARRSLRAAVCAVVSTSEDAEDAAHHFDASFHAAAAAAAAAAPPSSLDQNPCTLSATFDLSFVTAAVACLSEVCGHSAMSLALLALLRGSSADAAWMGTSSDACDAPSWLAGAPSSFNLLHTSTALRVLYARSPAFLEERSPHAVSSLSPSFINASRSSDTDPFENPFTPATENLIDPFHAIAKQVRFAQFLSPTLALPHSVVSAHAPSDSLSQSPACPFFSSRFDFAQIISLPHPAVDAAFIAVAHSLGPRAALALCAVAVSGAAASADSRADRLRSRAHAPAIESHDAVELCVDGEGMLDTQPEANSDASLAAEYVTTLAEEAEAASGRSTFQPHAPAVSPAAMLEAVRGWLRVGSPELVESILTAAATSALRISAVSMTHGAVQEALSSDPVAAAVFYTAVGRDVVAAFAAPMLTLSPRQMEDARVSWSHDAVLDDSLAYTKSATTAAVNSFSTYADIAHAVSLVDANRRTSGSIAAGLRILPVAVASSLAAARAAAAVVTQALLAERLGGLGAQCLDLYTWSVCVRGLSSPSVMEAAVVSAAAVGDTVRLSWWMSAAACARDAESVRRGDTHAQSNSSSSSSVSARSELSETQLSNFVERKEVHGSSLPHRSSSMGVEPEFCDYGALNVRGLGQRPRVMSVPSMSLGAAAAAAQASVPQGWSQHTRYPAFISLLSAGCALPDSLVARAVSNLDPTTLCISIGSILPQRDGRGSREGVGDPTVRRPSGSVSSATASGSALKTLLLRAAVAVACVPYDALWRLPRSEAAAAHEDALVHAAVRASSWSAIVRLPATSSIADIFDIVPRAPQMRLFLSWGVASRIYAEASSRVAAPAATHSAVVWGESSRKRAQRAQLSGLAADAAASWGGSADQVARLWK